ncbi:MAG: hypothetical protein IIC40_08600 [Candidatus Marinimicrobia bacterium]|nr:hypothetical protein [Candidatus Neomarinimicrobiota bacterium]
MHKLRFSLIKSLTFSLLIIMLTFACVDKDEQSFTSFIEDSGVDITGNIGVIGDTLFLLQTPIWGPNPSRPRFDYPFNQPGDVYVGNEPLVYVADTGNDRIFMLDTFGNIKGILEGIPNPVDMVQDSRLRLFIVNETSTIYFVDLFKEKHVFEGAEIQTIYGPEQINHDCELKPNDCWEFVGVTVYTNSKGEEELYIASRGPSQKNNMIHQFSLDTSRAEPYRGPLPFVSGGFGFFGVTEPTGITNIRGTDIDFVYTQRGPNTFKVQWIAKGRGETSAFEAFLDPRLGLDLFQVKFREPEDVSVDESRNLYVIDAAADSMYKFSSSGKLLQILGPVNSEVKGIVLTSDDIEAIYSDSLMGVPILRNSVKFFNATDSDTILLIEDNGRSNFEGWAGKGIMDYETGLFSVTFNDSLRSVFSTGLNLYIIYEVKGLNNPRGVSVFNKIVYIADTGNNRILRYKLSTDID